MTMLGGTISADSRRDGRLRGCKFRRITCFFHRRNHDTANGCCIRHRRAVHFRKQHAREHVHLRHPSTYPANELAAKKHKPFGDLAGIHEFSRQDEKRDRDQRGARKRIIHLVGNGGKRELSGEGDINRRKRGHRDADGGAQQDQYDQRKRKRGNDHVFISRRCASIARRRTGRCGADSIVAVKPYSCMRRRVRRSRIEPATVRASCQ